jgi:hypothetical protein
MATKNKELYISVNPKTYKKNKENLLKSQISILNLVKHLYELKKIKHEKAKLKSELKRLFSSISEDIKDLDEKLPKPKIPKAFMHKKDKKAENKNIPNLIEVPEQDQGIEHELKEIHNKLERLNA